MKLLAIMVGKLVILVGKVVKRGTTLPGKLALKIDKNLLQKFKYPDIKVVVTGSSGKGSTTALIAKTLQKKGYRVCYNESGANIDRGVVSTLLKYTNLRGKIKADYLVLEVDERYTKRILPYLKPNYLVITNLTKDQPPRQHYIDLVYNDILKSILKETVIITNMDDPYLRKYEKDLENKFIYYSISKNKYSYQKQIFENLNIYYCPYCGEKLEYDYYNFETLGKYHCSKCDFKYEKSDYLGSNLNLDDESMEVDKQVLKIGGDMLYNAYNTLAAFVTLRTLNIEAQEIKNNFEEFNEVKLKFQENKGKLFRGISCKAENATTYNQAIFKVINDLDKKDVVIGWKEISRRYDHYDISWLYDVEFELLNNESLNFVYACGIDADNIKKRLLLAGIDESKIKTAENMEQIKSEILDGKAKKVYGILNFDYMQPFKEVFIKKEEEDNGN